MKKSKQTKASERVDGANTLCNLPDDVLQSILSRIPSTEEVIRTSILSRRWRYLWTSIPSIDIDYSRGLNPDEKYKMNKVKEYKFTEFVYWVLLNKSLDLDSFRLQCEDYYNMSAVERWIHAAVTRNVKLLYLVYPRNKKLKTPHSLVTCGSLEVLRLYLLGGYLSLPNFTGFPSLRVLELNDVILRDANLVEAFFKSCHLLEDLSLVDCFDNRIEVESLCISCLKLKNLRIDNRRMIDCCEYLVRGDLRIACPELVFLELAGKIAYKFFFDSLDSLKKAVIHPSVPDPVSDSDSEHEPEPERICEVFAGISHVESLSISISFLTECIDREVDIAVSLPNLKTLEITIDCWNTDAVQFIKCFPDLESLHLNFGQGYNLLEYWKLDDAATMRILTRQLKKVDYFNFCGHNQQLKVACFFLEHGNALEEMIFRWNCDETKFHEMSKETEKKLLNFHKASSTVKLIALLKGWPSDCYYNLSSKV